MELLKNFCDSQVTYQYTLGIGNDRWFIFNKYIKFDLLKYLKKVKTADINTLKIRDKKITQWINSLKIKNIFKIIKLLNFDHETILNVQYTSNKKSKQLPCVALKYIDSKNSEMIKLNKYIYDYFIENYPDVTFRTERLYVTPVYVFSKNECIGFIAQIKG